MLSRPFHKYGNVCGERNGANSRSDDELDAQNQSRIQDAVKQLQGSLTIVIIAHRLSTVRIADQILVLECGQLVENGTYDDLATRAEGRFRNLIEVENEGPIVPKMRFSTSG